MKTTTLSLIAFGATAAVVPVDAFAAINVVPATTGSASTELRKLAEVAKYLRPLAFDPATPEYNWGVAAASKEKEVKIERAMAQLPLVDDEEMPSTLLALAELSANCDGEECRDRLVVVIDNDEGSNCNAKEKEIRHGDVLVSVSVRGTSCMECTTGFNKYETAELIRRCVACGRKKGGSVLDLELDRVAFVNAV